MAGELHEVVLPKLGMGTTEAEVIEWLVPVGDTVSVDTPVLQIETEKLTTEITAELAGTMVEHCVAPGEIVETGTVVCRIEVVAAR
jgi:pyruvate/2-oxoglutarate dehydrogenase complex dihydrolipoamide acyltransferase (E2) component